MLLRLRLLMRLSCCKTRRLRVGGQEQISAVFVTDLASLCVRQHFINHVYLSIIISCDCSSLNAAPSFSAGICAGKLRNEPGSCI